MYSTFLYWSEFILGIVNGAEFIHVYIHPQKLKPMFGYNEKK